MFKVYSVYFLNIINIATFGQNTTKHDLQIGVREKNKRVFSIQTISL